MSPEEDWSHLEVENVVSLSCMFPEVPCYSIAVFTRSWNEGLGRHVAKSMKDWPSPRPPAAAQNGNKCPRHLWSCPLCLPISTPFRALSPSNIAHKGISESEKEQISSNLLPLASLKGERLLLNAIGNAGISCDSQVSGEN